MTINNKNYSSPQNINLKGGCLRFNTTQSSNPFGDESYGLYVNGSGELIFRSTTTSTTLGATGGGGAAPSLDAIYAGDQTLAISGSQLTLAGSHATNDVLLITNASGKTGDCIQITNSGTGNDIEGTGDTWHFSKAGDMTANMAVFSGDATSDSITLTAGDVLISDGCIALTDADDAASLTITNNSAATASMVVFAGAGTFTGSTTTSFLTITPSGLTTGTAVYLPLAAITTGMGLEIAGGTTQTSGNLVVISSAATGITDTVGALLNVAHSGNAGTSAVLVGFSTAAADETILLKLTASDVLALGNMLNISAGSMTTGSGIVFADLAALTSGAGLSILSSAIAITTGRLLYISHTGATTDSGAGILSEFISLATDGTTILKVNGSTGFIAGKALNVVANVLTNGMALDVSSSSAVLTATGRVLRVYHSGATTTSGVIAEFKTAATDETILVQLNTAAMVDGIALNIVGTTGMTTGSLIRATSSTAAAVATNGIYSFKGTGVYTSTSNAGLVDIGASATVTGTIVHITSSAASQTAVQALNVTQSGATITAFTGDFVSITGGFSGNSSVGNVVSITGVNDTKGSVLTLVNNALTTGTMFLVAHATTVIADTGSIMRLSSSSADTGGATNATILDIANTGSVAGTLVQIKSNLAAQTSTCLLNVVAAGYTAGYTGSVVKITGVSTDGASNVLLVTGANTTAGNTVKIDAAAITTGTGLLVTSAGVAITTGSLVSLVADAATTCTGVLRISAAALTSGFVASLTGGGATITNAGGVLNLAMGAAVDGYGAKILTSGVYTGTVGVLAVSAAAATTGNIAVITGTGLTTGTALLINTTTATLTTGFYIRCNDGVATDFSVGDFGATVIAGSAVGTAALTITAGDIVLSEGTIAYRQLTETVEAANTLTAAETGKTCFLGHATEFVTTLPAVAAGLHFKFIVSLAPAGAAYTIVTPAGADLIYGNIVSSADAGGSADSTAGTKADTITFVDGQAAVGDWVEVVCDGTYWYAFGVCGDEDAITFTAT
jgi:hypothetical protein